MPYARVLVLIFMVGIILFDALVYLAVSRRYGKF